jgi:hypothetical protein
MNKKITVVINMEIELPSKAEVIRFTDEEGEKGDYIKFMGRLFRPYIDWLQYFPSHVTKKIYRGKIKGISWMPIDDDIYNEHFSASPEEWYMEEK